MNPDPQQPQQPQPDPQQPQQPVDPWQMPAQPAPQSFGQPEVQPQPAQPMQQPFGAQPQGASPFPADTAASVTPAPQGSSKRKLIIIISSIVVGLLLLAGAAFLIINLVTANGNGADNSGAGGNTSTAPVTADSDEKTFENDRVAFVYPSSWTLDPETYDLQPVSGFERDGEQRLIEGDGGLTLDYIRVQGPSGASLSEDQVKESLERGISFYDGYSSTDMIALLSQKKGCESNFAYVEKPKFVEGGSVPRVEFTFTCDGAEGPLQGLFLSTADTGAGTHTVVVAAPAASWNTYATDVQGVVSSLRLK